MSYTQLEAREKQRSHGLALSALERSAKWAVWAVVNAALLFAEQLAELLAPVLLLAGAIWWAIPRGLDAITLDGPANDILQQVRAHVPLEIAIGGNGYSARTLVADGLLCIGVVAVCRTLTSLWAKLLSETP